MANETIATAAPPAQSVKTGSTAPVKLPEAFREPPRPSSPAPEMDAFAELEQIDAKNPAPDSRPPKKRPEDQNASPTPKPDAKTGDARTERKTEPAKGAEAKTDDSSKPKEAATTDATAGTDTTTTGDDPSKKFQLASDLRKAYRTLHAESEKLKSELQQAKSRKPEEPSEDRKVLDSKLEALEKRNHELEEEISYRDYTKSNDFQEKFKKPFENKLARVYRQVADLYVNTEDGSQRPATREDFDRVLEAGQADARRIAKEIFGDEDFREVLQYRRELNELQQNADEELRSWREKAKERETTRVSEERKFREQAEVTFRKSLDAYTEKYPEWFGEVEGDQELNDALKKGFASVDRSQDRQVPLDERLDLLAAARLKAASFGRHIIQIKRLKSRVQELEEALKEYEKSAPGEGQGQRASSVSSQSNGDDVGNVNDEIDQLERSNPIHH